MEEKKEKIGSVKKTHFLTRTHVRRLMKNEGARLASDEAVDLLIKTLEDFAIKTTKKALNLVKDENRNRLTAEDIEWASGIEDREKETKT